MKKYNVKIKGITPLLQNKPEMYGFDVQWIEKKASTDTDKETLKKLYINNKGLIYQPSTHFEGCLMEAGKKIKVKGQGKSTYSKLFGSMVSIEETEIVHLNQKYEIFKTTVVNPNTKGRMISLRPMIKDWEVEFNITFEDEIPADVIKEAFEIAGKYIGVGDWRPAKKGKFGKFQVVQWKEL